MQSQILTPKEIETEFQIPIGTQRVWKCTNRYGWRSLCIKRGSRVVYKRADIENWLEARKGLAQ